MDFSKTQRSNNNNVASRTQEDVDKPCDAVASAESTALPQDNCSDGASHEIGSEPCDESDGFVNDSPEGGNDGPERAAELFVATVQNDSVQGVATNALSHGDIFTHVTPLAMYAASHATASDSTSALGGSSHLERDAGGDLRSQTKAMRGNPVTVTRSNSLNETEHSTDIEETAVRQNFRAKAKRRGCLCGLALFLAGIWEKSPQVMRTFIKIHQEDRLKR